MSATAKAWGAVALIWTICAVALLVTGIFMVRAATRDTVNDRVSSCLEMDGHPMVRNQNVTCLITEESNDGNP